MVHTSASYICWGCLAGLFLLGDLAGDPLSLLLGLFLGLPFAGSCLAFLAFASFLPFLPPDCRDLLAPTVRAMIKLSVLEQDGEKTKRQKKGPRGRMVHCGSLPAAKWCAPHWSSQGSATTLSEAHQPH